ncbi:MAG: hypothetical protein L6Q83_08655 [Gammaproteobacteria bacterium]|jgi:hypothetical protein|nr:hypothetical protein [Gammaproteobacteria bacterium]
MTTTHISLTALTGAQRAVCLASVLVLLAGCGARTSVSGNWEEPRSKAVPFGHVLVVGVSPNVRTRRSFEEAMVADIASSTTRASAAIRLGSPTAPLTAETVAGMVRASGADAVLVTRVATRRVALAEEPGRVGMKTSRPSSLGDGPGLVELFSQTYHEYEEPGEITTRSKAELESSVYHAVDGGQLVYTLRTRIRFEEGKDDVIGEVANAIARQLRRDGVIR